MKEMRGEGSMPDQGRSWWFSQPASSAGARPPVSAAPSAQPGDQRVTRGSADTSAAQADATTGTALLPSISLPKGGGAIKGIDEKLTIGPSGTAQLTVPVFTSSARQGCSPTLRLSYDSGSGNGPFGLGWNLTIPSVTRKTALGLPRYADAEDSDVFILSGAEDLVPLLVPTDGGWVPDQVPPVTTGAATFNVRRYRPRVEAGFARIERWQDTETGEVHWRTVSKDNVTSLYGRNASSRISRPGRSIAYLHLAARLQL